MTSLYHLENTISKRVQQGCHNMETLSIKATISSDTYRGRMLCRRNKNESSRIRYARLKSFLSRSDLV